MLNEYAWILDKDDERVEWNLSENMLKAYRKHAEKGSSSYLCKKVS